MTITELKNLISKAINQTSLCIDCQTEYMGGTYILRTYVNDGLILSFWNSSHMMRIVIRKATKEMYNDYITSDDNSITLVSKMNSENISINTKMYNIKPSEEEEFEINLIYDEDINLAYKILKEIKNNYVDFNFSINFRKLKTPNSIIDLESIDYHLFEKLIDESCE